MSKKEKILDWLGEQDGYYVRKDIVEEQFPNTEFELFGVTLFIDDDGRTHVPIRDLRHLVKFQGILD